MTGARTDGPLAIIPVRVDSQRLPGKALLRESGRPLFLHTCEQAREAGCFAAVAVATDDETVAQEAETAGFTPIMTSSAPRTGSERCAEALASWEGDCRAVVDIQGDWPEVDPADLRSLVAYLEEHGEDDALCATLATPLTDPTRRADPNVVKLVRGLGDQALYFSRLPVPYQRAGEERPLWRHIGVYGFTAATLRRIPGLPSSGLDELESLEQLRFLENGVRIQVLDATGSPWGIECRDDYDAFLQRLAGQADPTS